LIRGDIHAINAEINPRTTIFEILIFSNPILKIKDNIIFPTTIPAKIPDTMMIIELIMEKNKMEYFLNPIALRMQISRILRKNSEFKHIIMVLAIIIIVNEDTMMFKIRAWVNFNPIKIVKKVAIIDILREPKKNSNKLILKVFL
jgi:hypothetical protein